MCLASVSGGDGGTSEGLGNWETPGQQTRAERTFGVCQGDGWQAERPGTLKRFARAAH